jgi:murein DD-endopeptidase MepM/ murein hydrolase activator NlpD
MSELENACVVDFPLRGEWAAYHTPGSKIPSHGTDILAQRYAYDLLRVSGETGWNDHPAGKLRQLVVGVRTSECYGWGEPIHAPTDGVVVEAVDGVAERAWRHPIRELALVLKTALTADLKRIDGLVGNHVILRCTDLGDVYAAFAHLTTGSVAVRAGDVVRRGDVIGRVGHTGNSTAPHLHFQLMDGPDARTAKGVPCVFREYEVRRDGRWERVERDAPRSTDRIRYVPAPADAAADVAATAASAAS